MRNKITLKRLDLSAAIESQKGGEARILTDALIADLWRIACAGEDSEKALPLSYRWAMSMAQNLSNRMAHAKLIPGPTIKQAAFFLFWTEAATRIRARLVAKELSRENSAAKYLIPIPNQNITAFNGWGENNLFPLYLHYELRRRGIDTFLITNGDLSVTICNDLVNFPIHISNRKAFINEAVYQSEVVLTKIFNQEEIKNVETFKLFDTSSFNQKLSVEFQKSEGENQAFQNWQNVSRSSEVRILVDKFVWLMECWLQETHMNLKVLNELRPIHSLNVSTHLFPITALLMRVVKDANNCVSNWSHSVSNAKIAGMLLALDPPNYIQRVIPSRNDSEAIEAEDIVHTDLLSGPKAKYDFKSPKTKLNIILLGTAHELRGMPLLNYDHHVSRYIQLIKGLHLKRVQGLEFYVRPKTTWETMDWFQSLTDITLNEAPASPRHIDMENVVFLVNSFASGAVLEGLARGIPSFIVAPHATNGYLDLPFDNTMMLPTAEEALNKIEKIATVLDEFRIIRQRQISWFKNIISH